MVSIVEITTLRAPIERCFYLSLSVDLHQASTAETRERAIAGTISGIIGPGERVTWQAKHFGFTLRHTSEITSYEAPRFFEDTMVAGLFRSFRHTHSFSYLSGMTTMEDHLEFAAPLPLLGRVAEELVLRRYFQRFLRTRNAHIKQVAESEDWRRYLQA